MIKAYIDNSVISELRKKGYQHKNRQKFIFEICKKYSILAKNCIITDKLFLELIYQGDIRKEIVKTNEKMIFAAQSTICQEAVSKDDVKKFINFLEEFFDTEIRNAVPVKIIHKLALKTLQENPIVYRFRIFNKKILAYANNITKDKHSYDQFISGLVADSVVRYGLLVTAKEISEATFIKVASFLIKKYETIIKDLLLIFVAASKSKVEHLPKMKDKSRLIRPRDDFADVEPQYFVFYGKEMSNKHYPITFITCEPIEKIKERMDYYFGAGIVEIAKNSPRQNKKLLLGRSLIIDFKNFNYTEILSKLYLKQIPISSYMVLG